MMDWYMLAGMATGCFVGSYLYGIYRGYKEDRQRALEDNDRMIKTLVDEGYTIDEEMLNERLGFRVVQVNKDLTKGDIKGTLGKDH